MADEVCVGRANHPIWKCMSGIGDHQFIFLIDLLPNYTFYTNLTISSIGYILKEDVTNLMTFNLWKIKKSAESFDAGLSPKVMPENLVTNQGSQNNQSQNNLVTRLWHGVNTGHLIDCTAGHGVCRWSTQTGYRPLAPQWPLTPNTCQHVMVIQSFDNASGNQAAGLGSQWGSAQHQNITSSQSIRSAQDGNSLQSAKTPKIPRIND